MLALFLALTLSLNRPQIHPIPKMTLHRGGKDDMACDICKNVVEAVEEAMKSTTVEAEVAALVSQACQLLPSPYSSLCTSVVQQYVPLIMQWLEQGLEALDICVKIGLCPSAPGKKVRVPKGIPNDWACDMCQTVVKTVSESMQSTKVVEEVSAIVEQLCDLMPTPYSTLCHTLVKTYIGLIMELLDQGLQVLDVCVKIGLCEEKPAAAVKPIRLPAGAKKGAACDSCKQIVSVVEEAMKSTTVEAEVAALVSQACSVLPAPYSTICSTVVQQYVPIIMQWLEQGLETLDICVKLGLCDPTTKHFRPIIPRRPVPKDSACDMCKTIIGAVEEAMKSTLVEEEVAALVSKACELMPSPVSVLCSQVVQTYVPLIMQWVEQGLEALDICVNIGLCNAQIKVEKVRVPKTMNNDFACDMCKSVVDAVEEAMKSTAVEEEIAALVGKLCEMMPAPYSTICQSICQQYVPIIIQLLEQGLEALDICVRIGLCEQTKAAKIRIPRGIPNDWACDMCQTVVKTVEESMESTKVVEEVSAIVEQLCDLMPTPYSTLCHTLVKTYIGLIIELLEQGLQALDVCVKIGLCEPATMKIKPIRIPAGAKNDQACDICKKVVETVEEAMKSTTVEEEVAALVSQVCTLLPSPYSTLCSTIVQQYVPMIMQLIEQGLEALDICVKLGLCEQTQAKKPTRVQKILMTRIPIKLPTGMKKNDITCDICKGIVAAVEESLKSTTVEEEIVALVLKVCDLFPAPYGTLCQTVVQEYVPVIVQLIEQGIESLDICVRIGLCDAQKLIDRQARLARKNVGVRVGRGI